MWQAEQAPEDGYIYADGSVWQPVEGAWSITDAIEPDWSSVPLGGFYCG